MIVRYSFDCFWDSPKKERISCLISDRVLLLTGKRVFEKIESISFCEKEWIEENLSENIYLLCDEKLAALYIHEDTCTKKWELVLEKTILFSILTPGAGQACFDNMIIELGNAMHNGIKSI